LLSYNSFLFLSYIKLPVKTRGDASGSLIFEDTNLEKLENEFCYFIFISLLCAELRSDMGVRCCFKNLWLGEW